MKSIGLKCTKCNWRGEIEMRYECPLCQYPLEVFYDYEKTDRTLVDDALRRNDGVWEYLELLPVMHRENIISMHEGATPLIRSKMDVGCSLFWKDETRNPTLSFKDRPNTVGISMAKELGYSEVSIASTGNGGASLAAYSAKAGMKCNVCIPESTPLGKIVQQRYHAANIILCEGDYGVSFKKNKELSLKNNWANMTSTYLNPYTMEGDKTISYELFAQLGRKVPDWIVIPLGAGAMLTGVLKGFEELNILGFCDKMPKMVGVQAEGCSPIVKAIKENSTTVEPWGRCTTLAGAIADPLTGYEKDGEITASSVRKSHGKGVSVNDDEILFEVKELAKTDGLFVEPSSATVSAAVKQLVSDGTIKQQDVVVGVITAHGLKDAEELSEALED